LPRALAGLYADDAINHQVAEEPVRGRDAIHAMFTAEFARADMVCIAENLFADGDEQDPGQQEAGVSEFIAGERMSGDRGTWKPSACPGQDFRHGGRGCHCRIGFLPGMRSSVIHQGTL